MYSDCHDDPCGSRPRDAFREIRTNGLSGREDLIRPCDIRGILHSHSRWTDGAHSLESMIVTAREIGLEYLGISDHFQTGSRPAGLDLASLEVQREEIEVLRAAHPDFGILHGVEIDANFDGTLPLGDDRLAWFDFVIVSFPESGRYDPQRLSEQIAAIAANPHVAVLGDPLGDLMLRGHAAELDMPRILSAAAAGRTAVEVNAIPSSVDVDWANCRLAQELDVYMVISPNAHRAARLVDYRYGADLARDAGVCCGQLLNTMTNVQLRAYLDRNRSPGD